MRRYDVEFDGSYAAIGTYLGSLRERPIVVTVDAWALRAGTGAAQASVRLSCRSEPAEGSP